MEWDNPDIDGASTVPSRPESTLPLGAVGNFDTAGNLISKSIIPNNSNLILSYNLPLWTYFLVHTLEYGIDVDEGISVAPGTFDQTYVEKKESNLRNMEENSNFNKRRPSW